MTLKTLRLWLPLDPRVQRVTREFSWVVSGQAAAALGGLVGIRLLTHALPADKYGELALGMTVATLTLQTILLPIAGAALRFFAPAHEAGQLRDFLRAVWVLLERATLAVLCVLGAMALGLLASGHVQWLMLGGAALFLSLLSGYGSTLDSMQNAARHRTVVSWHDGLDQWLRYLTAVVLIRFFGASSSVAIGGYVLASAIVLGSRAAFFRSRILGMWTRREPVVHMDSRQWVTRMFAYAWPFSTWGVFTWAQLSSDRWALQSFGTTGVVGMYAVLYQIGYYPVSVLAGMIIQLIAPILFSRAGSGTDPVRTWIAHRFNRQLVVGTLGLTAAGVLITGRLHEEIFSILVAPEYRGVSGLLPAVVLSGGLFAAGQMASLTLMSEANSRALIAPKVGTAVLGSALNFVGARWFGLPGVVGAGITFSLIYLVWTALLVTGRTARDGRVGDLSAGR